MSVEAEEQYLPPVQGVSRIPMGVNVMQAAVARMYEVYKAGHRVIVAFSSGKDSGVCLEVCRIAAQKAGRDYMEVAMRDEEILFPGSFEYAERVAADPYIRFHWQISNQPIINVFSREIPFFWTFDPYLKPEQWVRKPPPYATYIEDMHIENCVTPGRFPPAPDYPVIPIEWEKDEEKRHSSEYRLLRREQSRWGKDPTKPKLIVVLGLRVQESPKRKTGLYSTKGYLTGYNTGIVRNARPIYDWTDSDIWLAIKKYGWDYNSAYDVMSRMGIPKRQLRIAPPTISPAGIYQVRVAAAAWPGWFDKMCERLPGVRSVVYYGERAIRPKRKLGESWETTFWRECVHEAPTWIAERAERMARERMETHKKHSTQPLPDVAPCRLCGLSGSSWKDLAMGLYLGDPFGMNLQTDPYVEPEFFRPGSGVWGRVRWW